MKRIVSAFLSTTLLAALASCSETMSPPVINEIGLPAGLEVSNPVKAVTTRASLGYTAATSEGIAYISASPGTFQGASGGTLSNKTRETQSISIQVVDGGFDPVAIPAEAGDELSLDLAYGPGRSKPPVAIKVPPRRPPKVVRTSPSRGRTDVAFNVQVEAVFSEPLDRSTVTESSLFLTHGGIAVAATVELSSDGLTVTVSPHEPLDPGQNFTLVSNGIKDLDGDALVDATLTSFITASAPKTPSGIASLTVLAPVNAIGINDNGVVVGYSNGIPVLISGGTVISQIPIAPFSFHPFALNNELAIVGAKSAPETFHGQALTSSHAAQWKDGAFTDLGTLPGHNYSEAIDINAAGDVIGISGIWDGDPDNCCTDWTAVTWHNGQISVVPVFIPYSINSRGEILGGGYTTDITKYVIWRDGTATILTGGCFDNPPSGLGLRVAMNNLGELVTTCGNKPYIWKNGQATALPMPAGCPDGDSMDIDDTGRIVGYVLCKDSPTQRAVVWMNGSVFQLPADDASSARIINNRGEILGMIGSKSVLWALAPSQ